MVSPLSRVSAAPAPSGFEDQRLNGPLAWAAEGWTFQPVGEAAVANLNDVARACL